jgi:hypothetical protein
VKATIKGNLYKLGADGILRRYILEHERPMILEEAHDGIAGGTLCRERNCKKYFVHRALVAYTSQRCEGILSVM